MTHGGKPHHVGDQLLSTTSDECKMIEREADPYVKTRWTQRVAM